MIEREGERNRNRIRIRMRMRVGKMITMQTAHGARFTQKTEKLRVVP